MIKINNRRIVTAYHPNSFQSTPIEYYQEKLSEALKGECPVRVATPPESSSIKRQKIKSKPNTYIVKDENGNELNTFTCKSLTGTVGPWIRDRIRRVDKIVGKKYYVYNRHGQLVITAQAAKWTNGEFKMHWDV